MTKNDLAKEFNKAEAEQKQLIQAVSNATMKIQQLEGRKELLKELHEVFVPPPANVELSSPASPDEKPA